MGKETGISWTDHTFNPWWGCQKVSPGCANCYAEAFAKRTGHDVWGPTAEYRTFGVSHWKEPLKWDDEAAKAGVRRRVFCASMADVFDVRGPESERKKLWSLIRITPNLDWQLLTKRPENWEEMLPREIPENIWLGFTAEDQEHFDRRKYYLATMNNPRFKGKLFVSYEPALGPIRLTGGVMPDWVIFGGETGGGSESVLPPRIGEPLQRSKRRPMDVKWAEDIKSDCERLGIAFFMKQMSAATPTKAKELIPAHLISQAFPISSPAAIDSQEATTVDAARKD